MNHYLIQAFEELFNEGLVVKDLCRNFLYVQYKLFFEPDGMVVMAQGIGIKQLFIKFIKAYCVEADTAVNETSLEATSSTTSVKEKRLVFCLNASGLEDSVRSALLQDGLKYSQLPVLINNKVSQQTRSAMYAEGGCYFITARIMIVDLLNSRVNAKSICGFLVFDGDKINEMSMDAFSLKLFKEANPDGFIKVLQRILCRDAVVIFC